MSKELSVPAPSFLSNLDGDTGLEEMKGYLSPPRLKIVQANASEKFEAFATGDTIVTPANELLCNKDGAFHFTPILIYDEFCCHNPYKTADLPMIRERSLDPKSELAIKCKNFVTEDCPEDPKKELRYCVHFNFLIVIHGTPALENVPVLMSLFMGEAKTGRNMLDLLRLRTNGGTPMYACVLEGRPAKHSGNGFNWIGYDISNPTADFAGGPWVSEAQFAVYKELHLQMKRDKELIQVNYEEDSNTVEASTTL